MDERTLPGLDFRTSRYSSETCLHNLLPGSEIRDSRFKYTTQGHDINIRKDTDGTTAWTVFVRDIQGELYTLSDLSASTKASEIYSQMTGKSLSVMRLMIGHKVLKHDQALQTAGIENGCSVNHLIRGCGGGKGKQFC